MAFITAVSSGLSRGRARQVMAWLPWLLIALCLAAWLWPSTGAASQWLFQSPQSPLQEQPPPPTPVPVPEQPTPAPLEPTPVPLPPPTPMPVPPEPTFPLLGAPAPVSPLPTSPDVGSAPPLASPRARARPTALARDAGRPVTKSSTGQIVISWTKFWDYLAILVLFPWLICGVILFMLAPVGFLYLEIRGRRRPPVLPESLPGRPDR